MSEPAYQVEFRAISKRPGDEYTSRGTAQEVSPGAFATLQNPSGELLTAGEWAARQRVVLQMKDKTYRKYPNGGEVGRFLRKLRVEGASINTLDSYEHVLRLLVLDHLDFTTLEEFCTGSDLVVDFLDRHWADSSGDTMRQRGAVVRSFFGWGVGEGKMSFNPAEKIKIRRARRRVREAHELAEIRMIAGAQPRISDQAAVLCYGRLGLRKMEGARLQARDIDIAQDVIRLVGKGDKPAELPITFSDVRQLLSLWILESEPHAYLVASQRGANRPLNPASVHRWWERCCEQAGVDPFPMHELRHSALHRIWRKTGDLYAAKQLARHASVKTTEDYLHANADDLRARMLESDEDK